MVLKAKPIVCVRQHTEGWTEVPLMVCKFNIYNEELWTRPWPRKLVFCPFKNCPQMLCGMQCHLTVCWLYFFYSPHIVSINCCTKQWVIAGNIIQNVPGSVHFIYAQKRMCISYVDSKVGICQADKSWLRIYIEGFWFLFFMNFVYSCFMS